ncbi:MAG: MFS transporter [Caldilineaceae bacterium]
MTSTATQPRIEQVADNDPAATFHTDQVFTVAGGHFIHDTYSAFIAPLIPLLQDRLGVGYAGAGGLAIYAQMPSLLNPFIGYLADRVSLRYFIILAPAVTATLMSCMGLTSSYVALAMLMLAAGVSMAAFHAPAPAMIGRMAGARTGTGMSIFMASGELGRTVGPLFVTAGVAWFGLEGIWRLGVIGWLTSVVLYWKLHTVSARPTGQKNTSLQEWLPLAKRIFPYLAWLMLGRALINASLTTYLPAYMSDVAQSNLWLAAASLSILEGAGVVGALFTGTISDRLGRKRVLGFLLAVAPLLLLVFLNVPSWLYIPLLILLGLTAISPPGAHGHRAGLLS